MSVEDFYWWFFDARLKNEHEGMRIKPLSWGPPGQRPPVLVEHTPCKPLIRHGYLGDGFQNWLTEMVDGLINCF